MAAGDALKTLLECIPEKAVLAFGTFTVALLVGRRFNGENGGGAAAEGSASSGAWFANGTK